MCLKAIGVSGGLFAKMTLTVYNCSFLVIPVPDEFVLNFLFENSAFIRSPVFKSRGGRSTCIGGEVKSLKFNMNIQII
jgi:hypothetical protein